MVSKFQCISLPKGKSSPIKREEIGEIPVEKFKKHLDFTHPKAKTSFSNLKKTLS
jgi:hypothetical protein